MRRKLVVTTIPKPFSVFVCGCFEYLSHPKCEVKVPKVSQSFAKSHPSRKSLIHGAPSVPFSSFHFSVCLSASLSACQTPAARPFFLFPVSLQYHPRSLPPPRSYLQSPPTPFDFLPFIRAPSLSHFPTAMSLLQVSRREGKNLGNTDSPTCSVVHELIIS